MSREQAKAIPKRFYGKEKFLTRHLTETEQISWYDDASHGRVKEMEKLLELARRREAVFKRSFKGIDIAHRD